MSDTSLVARGTAITLGAQAVRIAVQFAALTVLARLLDPADFGLSAMAIALVGVATVLGDFGLSLAAMRAADITAQQKSNLFWTNVAFGLGLSALTALCAGPIAMLFRHPEVEGIVLALSPIFLLSAATAQFRAEAARRLMFGRAAACEAVAPVVGVAVAIPSALAGGGYWALVGQQLATAVTLLVLLVAITRWLPSRPRRTSGMRSFYRIGFHTLLTQLLSYTTSNIDSAIIGRSFGSATLGFYDRAFQIFRLPVIQVAGPLTRVILPVLSRSPGPLAFAARVIRLHVTMALLMGSMFVIAFGQAGPIVRTALGPGWDESVIFLQILSVGGFFQMMTFVYYWAFLAQGRTLLQLKITVWGRLIMIVLMFGGAFVGPEWVAAGGTAGLGISWLIFTIWGVPHLGVSRRKLVRQMAAPLIVLIALSAGSLISATTVTYESGLLELVVELSLTVTIAGLICVSIGPARRAVREQFSFLKTLRRRTHANYDGGR